MSAIDQDFAIVGTEDLKPHPRNPRRGNVGAICDSIQQNGFFGACLVQKSTGHILAGNHRFLAAKEQGLVGVPVIWADVDDDTALRILLADNRTNDLASYDPSALAEILSELSNASNLLGTGYRPSDHGIRETCRVTKCGTCLAPYVPHPTHCGQIPLVWKRKLPGSSNESPNSSRTSLASPSNIAGELVSPNSRFNAA